MRRLAPVLVALLVPVLVVACGDAEVKGTGPEDVQGSLPEETQADVPEGDAAAGEGVFEAAGCGSCHTFEPAGTSGTTGPNLDESQIDYEGAYEQIAEGGGGMPAFKDQLEEQEIADVAAFVTQSRR